MPKASTLPLDHRSRSPRDSVCDFGDDDGNGGGGGGGAPSVLVKMCSLIKNVYRTGNLRTLRSGPQNLFISYDDDDDDDDDDTIRSI